MGKWIVVMVLLVGGCGDDATAPSSCCKVCTNSKPCGNTCIASKLACTKAPGCACAAAQVGDERVENGATDHTSGPR